MTSSEHKYESSNSVHHSKQMFEALSNQQKATYSNTNQSQTTSTPAPPTKHYRHYVQKHDTKDETSGQYEKNFTTSSLIQKNISMNSKSIKFHEEPRLEPLPFVPEPSRPVVQSVRVPPPPSPSKFVKGEFKESDYESDYERKGPAVWRPSNDSDSEPIYYKPIRPILTPTGRQSKLSDGKSPIPPTEFENPPQFEGPPRPKFEPIDKPKTNFVRAEPATKPVAQQQLFKPKPVAARPVQQPTYQQQPNQYPKQPCRYYTAVAGPPQHIAAETSNTMHMSESTESSHRVVNMSQTQRIIQFDARKSEFDQKLEPFPFSPDQPSYTQRPNRLPPPPTPTKFVPAEFRESDYESEVEAARIRPVWTPNPSDSDEPQYRRVSAPQQYRSASVPRSYGHGRVLTPMEFDTKPIEMPRKIVIETSGPRTINKTQTLDRYSSKKSHFTQSSSSTRDDIELKPSSPPKYGFIPGQMVNQAEQHMYDMNSTFKTKAQQFVSDVVRDTQTPNIRPILKKDGNEGDKPQIYREDSRVSQYGTKHIDPNTGLIYFKYDFGYEFGIIFPGQGKKIIGGTRHITHDTSLNNSEPFHASASDINIPVVHERTAAGNSNNGCSPSNEYLFTNDPKRKRLSLPAQIDVDNLTRSTPDRITPNFKREQSWNGRATTPIANYGSNQDQVPKRAPVFITPLKDIAVVNGNSARFECIVQCEPYPNISWSRNGVPLNQSPKHVIEFRNGVCRLTIPQAFTGDAGTYTCTGSNNIGTVATSAELLIPSDQWGSRK